MNIADCEELRIVKAKPGKIIISDEEKRVLAQKNYFKVLQLLENLEKRVNIEKMRRKNIKKKQVDTKASKGRKLRYVVIDKLINFYPATPEAIPWSYEKRNKLFTSLFM